MPMKFWKLLHPRIEIDVIDEEEEEETTSSTLKQGEPAIIRSPTLLHRMPPNRLHPRTQ